MTPVITALTIDAATLHRWVAAAINGEVFVYPVEVVGIQIDDECCYIDLRPIAEQRPEPDWVAAVPAPVVVLPAPPPAVAVPSSNGHHKQEEKPAPSAEAPKRITRLLTPEEQAAIRSLRQSGVKPSRIAEQLGLKVGTVYSYLERIGLPASRVTADEAAQHAV